MANIIELDDLTSYPGVVLSTDATNVLVIRLANGMVHDIIGDLDPIPTRVFALTLEVAARALRNPEGYSSVTKQVDDWKKTVRRDGDDSIGATGVFLTDAEEEYLLSLANKGSRGIGSFGLRVPGYANDF